jgi:hypothetical protein
MLCFSCSKNNFQKNFSPPPDSLIRLLLLKAFSAFLLAPLVLAPLVISTQAHAQSSGQKVANKAVLNSASGVSVEEIRFYYRLDADARYQALKLNWQNSHQESYSPDIAETLAFRAFNASSLEKEMTEWRYQGGPHPLIFFTKLYLRNNQNKAILNTLIRVTVQGKIGPLRVDPQVLMTNYEYLKNQATWKVLSTTVSEVPVFAPGEEMLLPVEKFQLMRFLRLNPNSWPESLRVEVTLLNKGKVSQLKQKTLTLIPDHFLLPEPYRY